ncbi:NACHT and WD repeat domain-containing 1 isoform X1 [Brachionus plicatilis]|uniref:NACHT and WD repeat domain-containing 1 isoform X1 n=1 Tax=Brachionus plicatilis TaxID=10195 RepID=A0A3M7PZK8_BRAPC|nr:NACHT and WD repeat domain-containing 1 isoform X1 [Brachionus plicatilis]
MKQRYFNRVEQIRTCHKDIANYFLESFVETKPLVDMNKNMQIRDEEGRRFICQQPLLFSNVRYNYRRLSELWYHLMNSGDIQRLKEHAFFNFEHLLAKCHGTSLQILLNDIEAVLRRILDIDILLMSSLIKKSLITLSQNPLRLSAEILSRLRPLQNEYGEHVRSLVAQASYWCENHDSPVLIPLSTWLDSPENLLITRIDHPEGIFKIAVTSFNQHVFFSTSKHDICMYHVPSKKLVRKFTGHTDLINCLQITYNNRFLISGSSDKLMMVWNLGTGEIGNTFMNHKSAILCSVITHSDEFIVTGCYDRLINVIRIENGDVIHSVEKHFDAITALAISEDDSILVSVRLEIKYDIFKWNRKECVFEKKLNLNMIFNIKLETGLIKRKFFNN